MGGRHDQGVGHGVVGAREGDVGGNFLRFFAKFFDELFFKGSRDGDDGDLDCLEEVALLVGGTTKFEVFGDGLVCDGHENRITDYTKKYQILDEKSKMLWVMTARIESITPSGELLFGRTVPGIFTYYDRKLAPYVYTGERLPWRVKNRLMLHNLGICGMYTAVISPDPCCMELDDMRKIADQAEITNVAIGLPTPVNDLVVRTRDVSAKARMAGSNPILVMSGIRTENPSFMQLKTEYSPEKSFKSFEEWHAQLPVPMYCMIHEENPLLQRQSVHGRLMRISSDQSWELSLGTNVLHARMIGQNASKFVGMGGHDINFLTDNVETGNMFSVLDLSSPIDARILAARFSHYIVQAIKAYEAVSTVAGKDVVVEFRIYDGWRGSAVAGLHVYDFDTSF